MAVKEIRTVGDPVLRLKVQPVRNFRGETHKILEDMADTMEHYRGVGLAAPQIGLNIAVVIIKPGDDWPVFEFINPRITNCVGEEIDVEGCLSCPGTFGEVSRCTEVRMEYQDRRGRRKVLNASGFFARIIQHELDHLAGILFVDKVTNYVAEGDGAWQT